MLGEHQATPAISRTMPSRGKSIAASDVPSGKRIASMRASAETNAGINANTARRGSSRLGSPDARKSFEVAKFP